MSRSRYKFHEAVYPYFFTCTIVGWLPAFTRPECVRIVFDSWKFLQDNGRMTRFAYVILENHLDFVSGGDTAISRGSKTPGCDSEWPRPR